MKTEVTGRFRLTASNDRGAVDSYFDLRLLFDIDLITLWPTSVSVEPIADDVERFSCIKPAMSERPRFTIEGAGLYVFGEVSAAFFRDYRPGASAFWGQITPGGKDQFGLWFGEDEGREIRRWFPSVYPPKVAGNAVQ